MVHRETESWVCDWVERRAQESCGNKDPSPRHPPMLHSGHGPCLLGRPPTPGGRGGKAALSEDQGVAPAPPPSGGHWQSWAKQQMQGSLPVGRVSGTVLAIHLSGERSRFGIPYPAALGCACKSPGSRRGGASSRGTKGRDAPWARGSGPANPHKDTVIPGVGRGCLGLGAPPWAFLETHTHFTEKAQNPQPAR